MPDSQEILRHLQDASRDARWLAVLWHVALGGTVIVLAMGWRPPRRIIGPALSVPLVSVGVVALSFGNLFNGLVMIGVALMLAWKGIASKCDLPRIVSGWRAWPAIGLIGFAWFYPGFGETRRGWELLIAAPMGVIPCPTLAMVLGLGLLFEHRLAKAWKLVAAITGCFYAFFGWLILGVGIDSILAAGSLWMLGRTLFLGQGRLQSTCGEPA